MINPLIAALGLDLDLSAEEIADVIWLATQMQQSVPLRARANPPAEAAPQTPIPLREKPFVPPKSRSEQKPQEPQGEIVPQGSRSPALGRSQELAFQVPDVRSLREPLTLARSLRPLMRRVATGNSTVLNEAATIQRIVEEQLWIPVLQPSLEPWLDLALVVDESDSMLIWRRTVTELQRLLENYGVFRTVRVWGLVETADRVQIRPGFGISARRQRCHSPSELVDPTGRCLVLVVSDCVAPLWQSGRVLPALKAWSQCGAMAIVQMLPEWLWRRTALGLATAVQLRALAPGLPNQQLTVSASESWDEADLETGIKVPVITLEPELFATWTQVVAGRGGVWTPGVVFEPSFAAMEEEDDRPSPDLTAEQRVQRFRLTASPMARRLAGLLAAAPVISLPIVRIVQDRLLNQSRQVHLAEVFLGGLLKPLTAIALDTNPDRVQYDFFEGVRQVLLESLPLPDSVDVLDAVSKFVASRMGLSLEAFAAVLRSPQQGQVGELAEQMQPFARVTAQVLKRLGGEYTKFAAELEGAFQENDRVLEAELELEAALAIAGEQERAIALTDLMARSSESPSVLLRSLSAIESEVDRISALIALIPYLPNILLSDALGIIRAIQNTSSRFQGLATIAALLPEVVPEALQAALDIEDESTRLKALTTVVEKMPAALLPQALEAARTIEDDYSRARVLIALAAKLPELIPSALDTIQAIRNNYLRAQALTALADLSPELLSHLPELRQKVNSLIEASSRILLRQARSTQVYVCCTANPWHLLFDALVIPVGHQGGLGNLGVAFQAYFSASADSGWLSQAIRNTMRTSRINRIRPDQPLFVKLPANVDIDTRLSSLEDFRSERVIICATSESEDETSSRNTSVAYEAVIRLIVNRRFRHVVLPLIGTGVNQLQVSDVVTGMIRAIDQILKSPEPLALKEIAIVDRDEDKIEAITGIFHRFDDLKTILFLAADPRNCRWVHLDQQIKEIKQRLNRRQKRDRFQFHLDHKWDVTDRDLQRLMLDFKPQIVHFLGHSVGQAGLALEDANGQVQLVGSESLAKLFKLFADREVGCVVLNACYSETQATAIAQHIPYVIGMDQAIGDRAAIEFTVGFYDALGAGRSIEFAYELACSAIQLAGLPEHLTPVLIKKSNLA